MDPVDEQATVSCAPATTSTPAVPADLLPLEDNPFIRARLLVFMAHWLAYLKVDGDIEAVLFLRRVFTQEQLYTLICQVCTPELQAAMAKSSAEPLGLDSLRDKGRIASGMVWNHPVAHQPFQEALLGLLQAQAQAAQDALARADGPNAIQERFREITELFRLSPLEADVLLLAYIQQGQIWNPFTNPSTAARLRVVAVVLGVPLGIAAQILANQGKLRTYGCLDGDFDLTPNLAQFLDGLSDQPLVSEYFIRWAEPTLPWSFYGALVEKHGTILQSMLKAKEPERGVSLLLYGEPGTGKSSFAASLAARLGLDLYVIKQTEASGQRGTASAMATFRFAALQLCDAQVDPARSLILIDEADEMLRVREDGLSALLGGGAARVGDKGRLNAVLDGLKTPCIWITNTGPEALDPSSRRRFDYSIRFDQLSRSQRSQVWKNAVTRHELQGSLGDEALARLADRYAISAGGIELVLRNCAAMLHHQPQTPVEPLLDKLLAPHCQLMGVSSDPGDRSVAGGYSLAGLRVVGTVAPEHVVEAVRRFRQQQETGQVLNPDVPRMNVLLYGPPGTGKTEFVKYLGLVLDCPVLVRMGGDLLSRYVGGTEENIRAAFQQAEAERAVLFLDEADGLFRSRAHAVRSWEVTQVNELLHRMESFAGILICATNAYEALDPATLRRFTLKLQFDYLDIAGKLLFYERLFTGLCPQPLEDAHRRRLVRIEDLAPGDFRTVRQSFYYLGQAGVTHEQLLTALEQESQAKQQDSNHPRRRFGFTG